LIVVIALCLVVGLAEAARTRSERYRAVSHEIAARRQSAAEAERLRIARELHDVLAHSLSQINVQAGVGVHLFDTDPERARANLRDIKETSSRALDEVRGVLGILRGDGETTGRSPEPDLSRLGEIGSTAASAGLTVTLENTIGTDAPLVVQSALFRIVQESVTNVIRHSTARTVSITLGSSDDGYHAVVVDPGPAAAAEPREAGRGLVGMRERVSALGGSLTAAATAGGGFEVSVTLPRRDTVHATPRTAEAPS
jgi:signal transduction histidine kinase